MISLSIVKKISGTLYVMAGMAKAFPRIKDVGAVLRKAAIANQGTVLSGIGDWFAGHTLIVCNARSGYRLPAARCTAIAGVLGNIRNST